MKFGRPIAILALVFSLAACTPDSGKVLAKEFEPAYTKHWTETNSQCSQRDKNGTCKNYIYTYIPRSRYVPNNWKILVTNGHDEGWADIPESEYNSIEVGSCWKTTTC